MGDPVRQPGLVADIVTDIVGGDAGDRRHGVEEVVDVGRDQPTAGQLLAADGDDPGVLTVLSPRSKGQGGRGWVRTSDPQLVRCPPGRDARCSWRPRWYLRSWRVRGGPPVVGRVAVRTAVRKASGLRACPHSCRAFRRRMAVKAARAANRQVRWDSALTDGRRR